MLVKEKWAIGLTAVGPLWYRPDSGWSGVSMTFTSFDAMFVRPAVAPRAWWYWDTSEEAAALA